MTIFLSSPSGLDAERKVVRDVALRLNSELGEVFGIHFDVIGWETHGRPGAGSSPQDVLNRQELDATDVFIGIMWDRYGTPTGRAGSGTQEEFDRALRQRDEREIFFYFKTEPVPPHEINVDQLKKVQKFKGSMKSAGVLYWDFRNVEDFKTYTRTHLIGLMKKHGRDVPTTSESEPQEGSTNDPGVANLGLLDYLDAAWKDIPEVKERTARMLEAQEGFVGIFRTLRLELTKRPPDYYSPAGRAAARTTYDDTARRLLEQVSRMNVEIPQFRRSIRQGVDAMTSALVVGTEDRVTGALGQVPLARLSYDMFARALDQNIELLPELRARLDEMPKMTAALNEARQQTMECITELSLAFEEGRRVLREAKRILDEISEP
ncbi:MAG: DUF4062 domain-containing protein [Acidobacteriota bacterium]|nr:DUF4062 domain-containing protein [Acidobacteriota bacterium]